MVVGAASEWLQSCMHTHSGLRGEGVGFSRRGNESGGHDVGVGVVVLLRDGDACGTEATILVDVLKADGERAVEAFRCGDAQVEGRQAVVLRADASPQLANVLREDRGPLRTSSHYSGDAKVGTAADSLRSPDVGTMSERVKPFGEVSERCRSKTVSDRHGSDTQISEQ